VPLCALSACRSSQLNDHSIQMSSRKLVPRPEARNVIASHIWRDLKTDFNINIYIYTRMYKRMNSSRMVLHWTSVISQRKAVVGLNVLLLLLLLLLLMYLMCV
jgi:hypothetical protein